jgi:tRNA U34 5-methylaminomethyl-2-thiouridine-forming methyltransferase MnmC
MEHEIFLTSDGSHSIYVKELDEHYHSMHGAVQESKHVFISAGLHAVNRSAEPITILEVGFGTGLNALLTLIESQKHHFKVHYTALEAYPLDISIVGKLNYPNFLGDTFYSAYLKKLHQPTWNEAAEILPNFFLEKINAKLQDYTLNKLYNLIYFDAFAPRVQPELWTEAIFSKLYDATAMEGVLVTYCAKGEVKRTLKKVGFKVESLPGPPGKREMVRAVK